MSYTFRIYGRFHKDKCFPSLNDYLHECGTNPKAGWRMKNKCMNVAIASIRHDLKSCRIKHPVILHYEFYEPKRGQKRDVMNVFALADKVVEDALVKTGILEDDSPKYMLNTTHVFYYTDGTPGIEVTIEEIIDESETDDNKVHG